MTAMERAQELVQYQMRKHFTDSDSTEWLRWGAMSNLLDELEKEMDELKKNQKAE